MLLPIDQVNRFVVFIVIQVFVVAGQKMKSLYGFKKILKLFFTFDIQLGYISTSQSKILENILSQSRVVLCRFNSFQNPYRRSVLSDDAGIFAEVVLKVPGRIVAACCDVGILAFQHFFEEYAFAKAGVDLNQFMG